MLEFLFPRFGVYLKNKINFFITNSQNSAIVNEIP